MGIPIYDKPGSDYVNDMQPKKDEIIDIEVAEIKKPILLEDKKDTQAHDNPN